MADVRRIMQKVAAQEQALRATPFLAPRVPGGSIRVRVAGLVYTFLPLPDAFVGWGIFQARDSKRADLSEAAGIDRIEAYLRLLAPVRLRLAYPLEHGSWLAYPINESDARQRFGEARPLVVHLVASAVDPFEPVIGRFDGSAIWFESLDRRADPRPTEHLAEALRSLLEPSALAWKGLTPEMRATYELVAAQHAELREQMRQQRSEDRLRGALERAGGRLVGHQDRGEFWIVEWSTADGERHSSAISKSDLTVLSAGICLAGHDRQFDLQSLVGVVERADD